MSSPKPGSPAGTIIELNRYPVKGMAGESVTDLHLGFHGPRGDRAYAWLRLEDTSGLPFLSPRNLPELVTYSARTAGNDVVVTTPAGDPYDIRDPLLRAEVEELAHEPLHLTQLWSHATDAMDTSIITTNSLRSIEACHGTNLDRRRFRPNIVLDAPQDHRAYPEDRWSGSSLTGGEGNTILHIVRHTQRCQVVDTNPDNGTNDLNLFATIRDCRKNRLGVYATTLRAGTLAITEPLTIYR